MEPQNLRTLLTVWRERAAPIGPHGLYLRSIRVPGDSLGELLGLSTPIIVVFGVWPHGTTEGTP